MNKVINSFSLIVMLAWCFFALGSINDLNFSVYSIRSIPFITEIVYALTAVILLMGMLRIKRRWEGLKDIKKFKKFIYTSRLSKKSIGLSTVFMLIEIIFMVFFILLSLDAYLMDKGTLLLPMFAVLTFLSVESIVFLIKVRTNPDIKIGVNKNLVAYFDREMHIYYFDGLQQLSVYQNRLHFKYKTDLNMFMELDIIPKDELANFKSAMLSVLQDKDVFFDESFREIGTK